MKGDTSALESLQQAVLLSHKLLERARLKDWAGMQQLDQERMDALKQAFESGFSTDEQAQARVLAEEVQQLNQQAVHQVQDALTDMRQSARDLQRNLQAAKAYLENTEAAQQNR